MDEKEIAEAGADYTHLVSAVDSLREIVKATVAMLVDEGFTDREAREITAGMWRSFGRPDSETEDEA